MKWIFLLSILFTYEAYSACTSATRSAFTTNQVLTSSRLNQEFNSVLDFVNSYDGGCISAGSLEAASMNSTEFAPLLKSIVSGCEISYVDSNTVGVSKCKIAVDGNLFETATQSNITWGCSGCSSEATGSYWVYIKDSTTFTPIISTTAPGKDGYNSTDKVVGGFYNNALLNIATSSVMTFVNSGLMPTPTNVPMAAGNIGIFNASMSSSGVISNEDVDFLGGDCANGAPQICPFQTGLWASAPRCIVTVNGTGNGFCYTETTTTNLTVRCRSADEVQNEQNFAKYITCIGIRN